MCSMLAAILPLLRSPAGPEAPDGADDKLLEVFISGDTARAIRNTAKGYYDRPTGVDLLAKVLQHTIEGHAEEMSLLHVAMVHIENNTYIGRLFFGNAQTKQVMWDTDARPSDMIYLALKFNVPIYVSKRVWGECAVPLADSQMMKAFEEPAAQRPIADEYAGGAEPHPQVQHGARGVNYDVMPDPADPADFLRPWYGDPSPILLLKRELQVAVEEEDYDTAIKIRDHPWMKAYKQIMEARVAGHPDAREMERALTSEMDSKLWGGIGSEHETRRQL